MVTLPPDGSEMRISASTGTGQARETCTNVTILDDDYYEEDVESLELHLLLEPGQSRVIVDLNVTTVFIRDDDGNNF